MSDELLWSRKGEIACQDHAPSRDSERWVAEGWQAMPDLGVRAARYQCQHCAAGPLRALPREVTGAPLILNVDDRPASLYAKNRMLRMHGFSVANADTGQSALEIARRMRPHLVLLDVHLPDIDGREVCQRLKSDRSTAAIPVVLISSTLEEDGFCALEESPCDGYIKEPVEPAELASAVWKMLKVS